MINTKGRLLGRNRALVALTTLVGAWFLQRALQGLDLPGVDRPVSKLLVWLPLPFAVAVLLEGSVRAGCGALGLSRVAPRVLLPAAAALVVVCLGFWWLGYTPQVPGGYAFLATAVVAPVTEEVLFRGFALNQLVAGRLSRRTALAATSALFGLAHAPNVWATGDAMTIVLEVAITGVAGLVLGLSQLATGGSLLAPMSLHAAVNGAWACFAISPDAIGGPGPIVVRIVAAIVALLTAYRVAPKARDVSEDMA